MNNHERRQIMSGILIAIALLAGAIIVIGLSSKGNDLSNMSVIASDVKLNKETPIGVLKEQLQKGNINREVYEIFASEKYGLNIP
jgi:hypothetical protein